METLEQIKAYLDQRGKEYIPAVLPPDLERMELHKCFDNCALLAVKNPQYRYVEGFATNPETGENMLHAWLTDGVYAYDPTWCAIKGGVEVPVPSRYFGIEVKTEDVVMWWKETEYAGILANSWRFPLLAIQIL